MQAHQLAARSPLVAGSTERLVYNVKGKEARRTKGVTYRYRVHVALSNQEATDQKKNRAQRGCARQHLDIGRVRSPMGLQAMDKFSARNRFEAVGVVGGQEDEGVGR